MTSAPSVFSLRQLLQLCKSQPNAIQLLISNPTALESLSKYPEQSLTALTELDAVEDDDEPEKIPYGLSSMGTSDMLGRVRHLSALDISYESSETMYAHNIVHQTMSGNLVPHRVVCSEKQARRTGCTTLLLMRGPHQPYMPDGCGALGVLLSATTRLDDWPWFENVFVSQTTDGRNNSHDADDWLYAGRYELKEGRSLNEEEIDILPDETLEHWAYHIHHAKGDQYDRLRARVYLSVEEDLDNATEADVIRCMDTYDSEIIISAIRLSDVRDSLKDGTIGLRAFSMRPVGYDVGVQMLLEQTRVSLQAKQEAEDIDIEVLSEPPRGTKRKALPAPIKPRHKKLQLGSHTGPGPSSRSPSMPRPKRRSVSSPNKSCEVYSSIERDYELPAPVAGPSSAGSSSYGSLAQRVMQ